MKNHIWRGNFNLHTGVSIFSNEFSSKNHRKSLIFIEKTWKIIDFHEKLWKIVADVEISFYIPACRIFLMNFHRKIIKNHWFSSKNHQKSLIFIKIHQKSYLTWKLQFTYRFWCTCLRRDEFLSFKFCSIFYKISFVFAWFSRDFASIWIQISYSYFHAIAFDVMIFRTYNRCCSMSFLMQGPSAYRFER